MDNQRYFLELAYKGTCYKGLQIQKDTLTVQGKINEALSTILNTSILTKCASRTDTGVHARQNFVHFDIEKDIPDDLKYHLNRFLPYDIVVRNIIAVDNEAHCRFDAVERSYEYILFFNKEPFMMDYGYYYMLNKLNAAKMNEAASVLMEYEDFGTFCKKKTDVKTKLCHIINAKWKEDIQKGHLIFNITANRFLRGMIRALVGTMLRVGSGEYTLKDFRNIIEKKDCSMADFSPPPQGLYLTGIKYPYL